MNPENGPRLEPPPVGKIRDLNKERAEKTAAFDFIPLERYEELVSTLDRLGGGINALRKSSGVPELEFRADDVRLIDESQWSDFTTILEVVKDSDGCWDPLTQKVYIKFSPKAYQESRLNQATTWYKMAHELGHKALPGAERYSFHLSEGLADFVARETLEKVIFTETISQADAKRNYIDIMQPEADGFVLEPRDIIFEEADRGAVSYNRIAQMRLVEKMRDTNREAFDRMLTLFFSGDYQSARALIQHSWGEEVSEMLTKPETGIKPILTRIRTRADKKIG